MRLYNLGVAVLLVSAASVCAATNYVVPTTTLALQTTNNTSAANSFVTQTNGNLGASNVSKVDVHSMLYSGATTKVYAHLLLWFGGSNHMSVGYSSTDANQIHKQITDMISRGIQGVIIDWYGPNNSIDQATALVMAEAEKHPGFTFAIMVDQGAIYWDSCSGCNPQQALTYDLQYIEQKYFTSPAYMTVNGQPVVTNFDIDLVYSIDWNALNAALSTKPLFLFQNNDGFTHLLSKGSYSWVMPTTTDYGMSYLTSFYDTGIPLTSDQTVGATYKGFNDTLASWGSDRVMGQQCGQTWLQTFAKINSLYNSGRQLTDLQLVTWNDYEEGTEIESGISNCVSISASVSGNGLKWAAKGNGSTIDHYVAYISTDGQNLMPLASTNLGTNSLNLCSFPIPNASYTLYVQAVGKPSMSNQMSPAVKYTATCGTSSSTGGSGGTSVSFGATPAALTLAAGQSGTITIAASPSSGSFDSQITLACANLPSNLSCSFAPANITPGNATAQSVLTIKAAAVTSENRSGRNHWTLLASFFPLGAFGLVFIGKLKCKDLTQVFGAVVLAVVALGASSCGGKAGFPVANSSSVTTSVASNYSVTVNGSSSAVQLSTTVTVSVQ